MSKAQKGNKENKKPKADKNRVKNVSAYKAAQGQEDLKAEPVMRHVQHLSFESLVKMDHFQKEPPLNLNF
jgi:hypothetical protein